MGITRNVPRANRSASAAPTVNDDITLGYVVGSPWQDTTNDEDYICLDNTDGAAVWYRTASATEGRVKAGTYTGDGTESQGITGIGFAPKFVKVWEHKTSAQTIIAFQKASDFYTQFSEKTSTGAGTEHYIIANALISLDSDGFTVDDNAVDADPNTDSEVYDYIAIG
jgi:hypothetical protein